MLSSGPLYTEAQIRALDRRAIAALGGDGYALMTRAAESVYRRLRARWPETRRLLVLCGRGHNGGDGYLVAKLAHDDGIDVHVVRATPDEPTSSDPLRALAACREAGVTITEFDGHLPPADLIVDALFGIGLVRGPDAAYAALIDAANAAPAPKLAIDVPSGLHTDSGAALGAAIRAAATVTFIARKCGLYTGDAPAYTGDIALETLGVVAASDENSDIAPSARLFGTRELAGTLRARAPTAHKGHSGHVLVVGGDHGYGGAARLAAEAAARGGAGLVSVATRAAHVPALLASRPEAMTHAIDEPRALDRLLERATVVAIGPGLGTSAWGRACLARVLDANATLVLDADALNLLAETPRRLPLGSIITPHPGEAARLLGQSTRTVQADRYAAACALAQKFRCVAVLKGAGTVIAAEKSAIHAATAARDAAALAAVDSSASEANASFDLAVCDAAIPALATGGSGDVLTGVIAALRAQGLSPLDAACAGVAAHATAAARVARGRTRGVLARDLVDAIADAVNP